MYDVSLKCKWDKYAVHEYWETKGRQEGVLLGIKEGLEQGRLNTMKENALTMLHRGFDTQTISEIIGLSLAEIEKLRESVH
ncbi:hypothetical protein [Lonepinella sp. BR2271]|uniref:hypothetical protein n=1 Tax=Lonepinella sp. BR2271 TaxID=3434550 RepID=UPI003F6E196D